MIDNLLKTLWSDMAFTQCLWHIVNFRNPALPHTLKRAGITRERFEVACEGGGLQLVDFLNLAKALDKTPDNLLGCVIGVMKRDEHAWAREEAEARRKAKKARRPITHRSRA